MTKEFTPSTCSRCLGTYILIKTIASSRYAQASLCECFPKLCTRCGGSRFVLSRDEFKREMAVPCPICEQVKRRIMLYNEARIPQKYAHSRLSDQERDNSNEIIFGMFRVLWKALAPSDLKEEHDLNEEHGMPKGILLMGKPGTGKTHLMTGFAYRCTVYSGASCVFQGFSELLSELRQGYSAGKSEAEIIEPHLKADVLIIDDLGKGRNNEWEMGVLDMLISERYNRDKIIMATTNYTESEDSTLKERILSKDKAEFDTFKADTVRMRVGERMYSRLNEMCHFVHFDSIDRRIQNQGNRA